MAQQEFNTPGTHGDARTAYNANATDAENRLTTLEAATPQGLTPGVSGQTVADNAVVQFGTPTLQGGMTTATEGNGHKFIVPSAGVYLITFWGAFQSAQVEASNPIWLRIAVQKSSVENCQIPTRRWNAHQSHSAVFSGSISLVLNANDEISFKNITGYTLTQASNTNEDCRISIARIGA